jgi:FKBP-type peptidyl-prolyl cis-trans isomerase FklB
MNRMNKFSLATSLVLGLAPLVRADTTNVASNVLSDDKARVSYAIGLNIGHNFKQQDLDVNPDLVGRAIKDVLAGSPELMTEAEVKETLTAFQNEFRAKQQARMAQLAITNKADGEAFLATNKNQTGVITLADG